MPASTIPHGVIDDAVQLASRAPSFHNSQPWQFVGRARGVLDLYVDHGRLVDADPSGRQALISCGAILDHLRVATASVGWVANVDYCPNPNDPTHLASIEFVPMTYVTEAHRRRADAIRTRRTDRLPYEAPTRWAEFEPLLRQAVDDDLAILDVLPDGAKPELAKASQLSEALRLYDSTYHAELDWWTGPFVSNAGIPPTALTTAAESDRVEIGRNFPILHRPERREQVVEDRSKVLVLSALGNTRRDVLTCGEALSVALLEATMVGLATCPLTHMTEVAASRDIISEMTGQRQPQILIRVGVAPADDDVPPPTPRRSLNQILTWTPVASEPVH